MIRVKESLRNSFHRKCEDSSVAEFLHGKVSESQRFFDKSWPRSQIIAAAPIEKRSEISPRFRFVQLNLLHFYS